MSLREVVLPGNTYSFDPAERVSASQLTSGSLSIQGAMLAASDQLTAYRGDLLLQIEAVYGAPGSEDQPLSAQRLEAKQDRDRLHEGTAPEVVWGEAAAKPCRDFLTFAKHRGFNQAHTLEDSSQPTVWSIRGYGVGSFYTSALDPKWGRPGGMAPLTNLPWNVFLCEDGKLHTFTAEPIKKDQAYMTMGKVKLGPAGAAENLPEPRVIADLPVDHQGRTYIPPTGVFQPDYVDEDGEYKVMPAVPVYQDRAARPRYGEVDEVATIVPPTRYDCARFEGRSLKTMLIYYARLENGLPPKVAEGLPLFPGSPTPFEPGRYSPANFSTPLSSDARARN